MKPLQYRFTIALIGDNDILWVRLNRHLASQPTLV